MSVQGSKQGGSNSRPSGRESRVGNGDMRGASEAVDQDIVDAANKASRRYSRDASGYTQPREMGDSDGQLRILPMEERIKNDISFVISKFGEGYVASDTLKRQVLLEELEKYKTVSRLSLENLRLKEELKRAQQEQKESNKTTDRQMERINKEVRELRERIRAENGEKMKMQTNMVRLLEREKNTRERILGYMDDDGNEDEKAKEEDEAQSKVKAAQYFDDVWFP